MAIKSNINKHSFLIYKSMQKSDLLSLYDAQMRITLQLPGVTFERSPRIS